MRTEQRLAVAVESITYHIIVDLERQNRLKVGTDKPKLKVKMQSVSEWWCPEKTSCEATFWTGGERCIQNFRLGRCYIFRQGVPGSGGRESTATDGWSLWPMARIELGRTICQSLSESTIHQRHGRTDGRTTCDRNTALCTTVHRSVIIIGPHAYMVAVLCSSMIHNHNNYYPLLALTGCLCYQFSLQSVNEYYSWLQSACIWPPAATTPGVPNVIDAHQITLRRRCRHTAVHILFTTVHQPQAWQTAIL